MEIDANTETGGEQLATGPVAAARDAASAILIRGGSERLEVLLGKRNPGARFMAGVWVFPGGGVDAADRDGATDLQAALRAAAVREAKEEVGIEPDIDGLVHYSNWITPEAVKIRFDTHFYLAEVSDTTTAKPDNEEIVAADWFEPGAALAQHQQDELPLVFPTIKHLEALAKHATAADLLATAANRTVVPVLPRIEHDESGTRVLLPSEAGFGE